MIELKPLFAFTLTFTAFLCVLAVVLRRRGDTRSIGQRIVYGLYAWARLWSCIAVAADKALLYFRLEKQLVAIEPENEIAQPARVA